MARLWGKSTKQSQDNFRFVDRTKFGAIKQKQLQIHKRLQLLEALRYNAHFSVFTHWWKFCDVATWRDDVMRISCNTTAKLIIWFQIQANKLKSEIIELNVCLCECSTLSSLSVDRLKLCAPTIVRADWHLKRTQLLITSDLLRDEIFEHHHKNSLVQIRVMSYVGRRAPRQRDVFVLLLHCWSLDERQAWKSNRADKCCGSAILTAMPPQSHLEMRRDCLCV